VLCEGGEVAVVDPASRSIGLTFNCRGQATGALSSREVERSSDGKHVVVFAPNADAVVWSTLGGQRCYELGFKVTDVGFSSDGHLP
jgi:hypothetical protein